MKIQVEALISSFFARLMLAIASLLAAPAFSAPLDALLDARPARNYMYGFIEVGGDFVNDTVDVFGVRDEKDAANGVGDYTGGHLRLGWQFTDRLWLEGSAWQRQVTYGLDKPEIESFAVATQYRFFDQPSVGSPQPDAAIRFSYWMNRADEIKRSSPVASNDPFLALLQSSQVSSARDDQQQVDLLLAWAIKSNLSATFFAGVGQGKVSIGGISGRYENISVRNAGGCSNSFLLSAGQSETLLPSGLATLVVDQDVCYDHSYAQLGTNIQWMPFQDLTLRAGYVFQKIDRQRVDDRIRQDGDKPITEGHTLIGEAAYRFAKFGQVFVRGQLMSGPFLGEIPFLYNRITAPRFDKEYGFVTVGLILDF
jgi:hypothetical protein